MWIETDRNGDEIRSYFSSKTINANNRNYKINAYQSGETGSMITVDEISRYGIRSNEEALEMTQIGFEFYKHLRKAPNFRYALTGIEVDGWREINELYESPNDIELMKGFVINKKLYELIKCSVKMKTFRENYLWIPYEGEKYIELKKN